MRSLVHWFSDHHPDRTLVAGSTVMVDIDLALQVIGRAEAAGVELLEMQGWSVEGATAHPVFDQHLTPRTLDLLDCETPSGASCGAARRAVADSWSARDDLSGRHMVSFSFDEFGAPDR